jgi:uncharacterized protein
MDTGVLKVIETVVAAFLAGLTKTGVPGLGMLIVPLLAAAFGAKASAGVMLPMLLFGDVFAVAYYKRHANWGLIIKLLPWVLAGLITGLVTLNYGSDRFLTPVFGVIILAMVALKLLQDRGWEWLEHHVPHQWWFSAIMGFLAGFTTAVGNLAGTITTIYFLSMGLDKYAFIGTGAWFFFIVNALKFVPYMFIGVITTSSLTVNLETVPVILVGIFAGFYVFRVIPQAWFDRLMIVLAAIAGVRMLWVGCWDYVYWTFLFPLALK